MFVVLNDVDFIKLNEQIQAKLKLGQYPYGNPFDLGGKKCQIMYYVENEPVVENAVTYVISNVGEVTTLEWKNVSLETVLCLQGLFPV